MRSRTSRCRKTRRTNCRWCCSSGSPPRARSENAERPPVGTTGITDRPRPGRVRADAGDRRRVRTTSIMPRSVYQAQLLDRGEPQRWENLDAPGYQLRDLDGGEIRRTAAEAINAGRLQTPVESKSEVLRKLHLVREGAVSRAAVVA